MKEELINLVKNKKLQICGHWDTDGVASAAMLYHLLKPHCASITTITKGKPFLISPEDINEDAEAVICTDIVPSEELLSLNSKIIYIDHHPNENSEKFHLSIHDPAAQSTTLLIYNTLLQDTKDPYLIFLALIGYFGDGGDRNNIPPKLKAAAEELIPEMLEKRESMFSSHFLEIERHVSALNTGKRLHWSGEVPLELLKSIDCYKPFVNNFHPLAVQLQQYRAMLKEAYDQDFEVSTAGKIDYVMIKDPRNIQGVVAARYINGKPIIVMNQLQNEIIGSMRVPDNLDFDAGKFLEPFNEKIESFCGGGHEKAAGFTMEEKDLSSFIEILKNQ